MTPSLEELAAEESHISLVLRDIGCCEECGTDVGVSLRPALTAYHYEGKLDDDENPNRNIAMCSPCHEHYESYWRDMWGEYYASVGY